MKHGKGSVLTLSSSFFKLSVLWEDAGISIFTSDLANRACSERKGRPLSGEYILGGEPLRLKHSVYCYCFTFFLELVHDLCNCPFVK